MTLSVLGAMLGGVDYLCATGYDEALRIPSVDAAALALRTLQVVGYEHGATTSLDPLDGSRKLAAIDEHVASEITAELRRIEELGGALAALRDGHVSSLVNEHRGARQRQLETGKRAMVGTNVLQSAETRDLFAGRSAPELDFAEVERSACARVRAHRRSRDAAAVARGLDEVEKAAASTENLLPPTILALRAGATSQEIVTATRSGFER